MWNLLKNDVKKPTNKQQPLYPLLSNSLCMFTKFTTKQIIGDMKRNHYKS